MPITEFKSTGSKNQQEETCAFRLSLMLTPTFSPSKPFDSLNPAGCYSEKKSKSVLTQLCVLDINNPAVELFRTVRKTRPETAHGVFRRGGGGLTCLSSMLSAQSRAEPQTRGCKIGIVCVFIDRIRGRSFMELCAAAVMVQSIRPLVR